MTEEVKNKLGEIFEETVTRSIREFADEICMLRKDLNDDENQMLTDNIRSHIQREAVEAVKAHRGYSMVIMATGTGKSKIAVDLSAIITEKQNDKGNIVLAVPTIKLRDTGWRDEFLKWNQAYTWEHNVQRTCYASIHKIEGQTVHFAALDEGHNFTERNAAFFENNTVERCVLFTATKPADEDKIAILQKYRFKIVYELNLDEAVKLGLVAPYEITVINMQLDDVHKYIKSGNHKKYFFQTEAKKYKYLTDLFLSRKSSKVSQARMRFIYTLRSKTNVAKLILKNVIPEHLRGLIFCGSIEQAIEVCNKRYFSKPTSKKTDTPEQKKRVEEILKVYRGNEDYIEFAEMKTNRLACVDALNEGLNIPEPDFAFVIQLNSKELDLIQRMGRILRYRPGHIGRIIILCVGDTVDREWVNKALMNLSPTSIRTVELSHLRMGLETIKFD